MASDQRNEGNAGRKLLLWENHAAGSMETSVKYEFSDIQDWIYYLNYLFAEILVLFLVPLCEWEPTVGYAMGQALQASPGT